MQETVCNATDAGLIPESGRSPGEGNGNHFTILAWDDIIHKLGELVLEARHVWVKNP